MRPPHFTLVVATSRDGFIARGPRDNPALWASPEEQALFLDHVAAADWSIMGRHTHEAADRPQRRRILFSTTRTGWQRPTQLWLDPADLTPADLPRAVGDLHPMRAALILGGTRVHDWFLAHRAIDRILLTIEPISFGAGLPLFTGHRGDPEHVLAAAGFRRLDRAILNAAGTQVQTWKPAAQDRS